MCDLQTLRLPEQPLLPQAAAGAFTFATPALTAAGPHTLTAEWQESRAGLPLGTLRSPACSIAVAAGPPLEVEVRSSLFCQLSLIAFGNLSVIRGHETAVRGGLAAHTRRDSHATRSQHLCWWPLTHPQAKASNAVQARAAICAMASFQVPRGYCLSSAVACRWA